MRRPLLVIMLLLALSADGCAWLVPSAVKREVGLMRTDVKTALQEVKAAAGDEAKRKALLTLERLDKGLQVVDDYANGRPATKLNTVE